MKVRNRPVLKLRPGSMAPFILFDGDLARGALLFFHFRNGDLKNGIFGVGRDILHIGIRRERKASCELAVAAFELVVVFLVYFAFGLAFARYRQDVLLADVDVDILFFDARQIDFDVIGIFAFAGVDGRCERGKRIFGTEFEDIAEAVLKRFSLFERIVFGQ